MYKSIIFSILFAMALANPVWSADFKLTSPDGEIFVGVYIGEQLSWSVYRGQECLIAPSRMSMELSNNVKPGVNPQLRSSIFRTVDQVITPVVAVKNREIRDQFNELVISFRGEYDVVFRAYDHGAAYRFVTRMPGQGMEVVSETIEFNFESNHRLFWPEESSPTFQSHYENYYRDIRLNAFMEDQYGALPFLLVTERGTSILITESDLYDYPNFFLYGTGSNRLTGALPNVILESVMRRDRQEIITGEAGYIARTSTRRDFPWRVVIVAREQKQLLENELVFQLSRPNVLEETSWIRPGKVAWDWWNANNIYGVDFRAGINTETYKFYIDFAAEYGLEYIILDEGWSVTTMDLSEPVKDLDLEELFRYADEKQVGIILWVLWNALDKDIEGVLDRFAAWGAKGIKVDFMVRADQGMVNYYEQVAAAAAERRLLVNFHGSYKPVGLHRKYPNILSYEGVRGLENHKWSDQITPGHNVTLPFIRMVAGPMDYTPGAMVNATRDNFCIRYTQPMSQGTRAHQAAMYAMYESPMQMLADNPSNYLMEPGFTRFISRMPVVWDRTVGLDSRVGEYAALARKKGNNWYIGAMTDWTPREMEIPTDFLDPGAYVLEFLQDGPNADRHASDYQIGSVTINRGDPIRIKMAPGGGWLGILRPMNQ
jgi:alpha-glucosidase